MDFEQEKERLSKEEERLNKEIKRAQGMLANEKFVSKAPADKVQAERDKLEKYMQMLETGKREMPVFQNNRRQSLSDRFMRRMSAHRKDRDHR